MSESILFTPSARSRDSIDTASNSISSIDSDDLVVVTNDPQYPEHSHLHQSRVYVEDTSPLIHIPPFYSGNVLSPTGVYDYGLSNLINGAMEAPKPKPRQYPKPMSKQKALKYKSMLQPIEFNINSCFYSYFYFPAKPCKFFTTDKGCPNGSSCTL